MQEQLASFIRRHGDRLLAAAITGVVLLEVALTELPAEERLLNVVVALAMGVAAAQRVRAPLVLLASLLLVAAAWAALPQMQGSEVQAVALFGLLAVYSAAAHTSGRSTLVAGTMVVGTGISVLAADPAGITSEGVVFYLLIFGLPWVAGRAVRQRRLKEGQLETERVRAAAAIVEERARIARELHDVVAHSISVMVIQARGGRRVLDAEPADARGAFDAIERTGHEALDEMRRLLGMLRRRDEEVDLAPQPSLRELNRLVEQIEAAGLPVKVAFEGQPRELPPGVELSAYRIVQEALTNVLKHAGKASARVVIRYGDEDLELEVADDGSGGGDGSGPGYGMVGMRERVSVYGGELEAGHQAGGGYAVRVRLPLGSVHS
jgi:signal transduction histidine kinase